MRQKIAINAAFFLVLAVVVFGALGYGLNAYKAFHLDFKPPLKAEVVRVIGVFVPPVGAVVGYMTLDEEAAKDTEK